MIMTSVWRGLWMAGVSTFVAAGLASAAQFQGVIVDKACSTKMELRIVSPGNSMVGGMVSAEAHTKECLLMPDCQKSGYGLYTQDNKYYSFDAEGSRKALALIKSSAKLVDFEVEVTGDAQGDTLKVTSIKLK
jgi:hypothetical protein